MGKLRSVVYKLHSSLNDLTLVCFHVCAQVSNSAVCAFTTLIFTFVPRTAVLRLPLALVHVRSDVNIRILQVRY